MARELPTLLTKGYPLARQWASDDTHLPRATFPEACPWTPEQVLDTDFFPEPSGASMRRRGGTA